MNKYQLVYILAMDKKVDIKAINTSYFLIGLTCGLTCDIRDDSFELEILTV